MSKKQVVICDVCGNARDINPHMQHSNGERHEVVVYVRRDDGSVVKSLRTVQLDMCSDCQSYSAENHEMVAVTGHASSAYIANDFRFRSRE